LARIQRQQLLLESILNKVKTGQFINNKLNPINLYKFWDSEITKDFTDLDLLNMFSALDKNIEKLTLNKIELPVGTSSKDGLIYHPSYFYNKQWVFIPSDKEYKAFKKFFSDSI